MEIDECESWPCQNNGTCFDELNEYFCNCTVGWEGTFSYFCQIDKAIWNGDKIIL